MKILHIIPTLRKGGAERLVVDICRELATRENVEARIVTFRNDNDYSFFTNNLNITTIPSRVTPSITGKSIIEIDGLSDFILNYKPHIIHSHLFEAEIVSRHKTFDNVSYITHLHDRSSQYKNLSFKTFINKKLFTNYLEKRMLINQFRSCNNHFIAISNSVYDYFMYCLPRDLRKITLLPNATDLERFVPSVRRVDESQEVRLISIGYLCDRKNHIFLIGVVKRLIDNNLNVRLDIYGDGPNASMLKREIDLAGLQKNIILHGFVNNVEEQLREAHIYLHSAIEEPFGLVLIEAMASGLPCVAIDGGGNKDVIKDGVNGYLLKSQDQKEFSDKVMEVIRDQELYKRLSQSAIEVSKKYSIRIYIDRLLEFYRSTISWRPVDAKSHSSNI